MAIAFDRSAFFQEMLGQSQLRGRNPCVLWIVMGAAALPCTGARRYEDSEQFGVVVGSNHAGSVGYVMIERERDWDQPFDSEHFDVHLLDRIAQNRAEREVIIAFNRSPRGPTRVDSYRTCDGRALSVVVDGVGALSALHIEAAR